MLTTSSLISVDSHQLYFVYNGVINTIVCYNTCIACVLLKCCCLNEIHFGDFNKAFGPPLGGIQMLSYGFTHGKTDFI